MKILKTQTSQNTTVSQNWKKKWSDNTKKKKNILTY